MNNIEEVGAKSSALNKISVSSGDFDEVISRGVVLIEVKKNNNNKTRRPNCSCHQIY